MSLACPAIHLATVNAAERRTRPGIGIGIWIAIGTGKEAANVADAVVKYLC